MITEANIQAAKAKFGFEDFYKTKLLVAITNSYGAAHRMMLPSDP